MSKKMIVVLSIIICIISVVAGVKYSQNLYFEKDMNTFLNQFNYDIYSISFSIKYIEENANDKKYNNSVVSSYNKLLKNLYRCKDNVGQAENFMGKYQTNKRWSSVLNELTFSLENLTYIIDTGINVSGKHISNNFLEDGLLSPIEIDFLVSLREDLLYLREKLYSEETGQRNQDLTLIQFKEIVTPFIEKYGIGKLGSLGPLN